MAFPPSTKSTHIRVIAICEQNMTTVPALGRSSNVKSSIIISCYGLIRLWRRSGLVVVALVSGSSGPGSSGLEHYVVFLGTTLNPYTATVHPGL